MDYIHENPVEVGFVAKSEDFLYRSTVDYAGEKGMMKIEFH